MTDAIFEPITKYTSWRLRQNAQRRPQPWQWPLVRLGDREPTILGEHIAPARRGVDIGYAPAPYDGELFVPVYAVQTGEVAFALDQSDGGAITIEHDDPQWATHYAHLSKLLVTRELARHRLRRQRVHAGDVIGYAAKTSPHVRFELWQSTGGGEFVAVDPRPHLAAWSTSNRQVAARDQDAA